MNLDGLRCLIKGRKVLRNRARGPAFASFERMRRTLILTSAAVLSLPVTQCAERVEAASPRISPFLVQRQIAIDSIADQAQERRPTSSASLPDFTLLVVTETDR